MPKKRDILSTRDLALTSASRFTTVTASDYVLIADENDSYIFDGSVYVDTVHALVQEKSWGNLHSELAAKYSVETIRAVMTELGGIGYIRQRTAHEDSANEAWWESIAAARVPRSVQIKWLCNRGQAAVEQALASCNISITEDSPATIVLTDDYLRPELAAIGHQERPWLLAKAVGHTIWVGPIFQPGTSPCWECLAWWIRMNRWRQWAFFGWREGEFPPQPSIAQLRATLSTAAGMIATACAVWLSHNTHPELTNQFFTFDTRTLKQTWHTVLPVPGCPHCGGQPVQPPANLERFVSGISGMVRGIEVTAEPFAGLYQAHAEFVHALPHRRTGEIMRAAHAYGRGQTPEAARTVCLAEAVERYSYSWRGDETLLRARLEDLQAIHPNELMQYSETQYRARETWNAIQPSLFYIPVPFDPAISVRWAEAPRVGSGPSKYVPAAAIYFAYDFEEEPRYCVPDSNGCAAGQTLEDALAAAFCELIERDAVAIWWYNRVQRPSVDLEAFDDDRFDGIVRALREIGRDAYLLDITNDVEIPAYVALAPRLDGSDPVIAAAAHPCAHRAAYKALAEVSQNLYWKERVGPSENMTAWFETACLHKPEFDWLLPTGAVTLRRRRRIDSAQALLECEKRLAAVGVPAYWIDLKRSETGLPVVRAIAPGLRHPWSRFAPGRLYDVPVKLGWLARPTPESKLNPIGCFL